MRKKPPRIQPSLHALSTDVGDIMVRLFSVVSAHGLTLPSEMLSEIEAISKPGADPEWQVKQLTEILDRWASLQ